MKIDDLKETMIIENHRLWTEAHLFEISMNEVLDILDTFQGLAEDYSKIVDKMSQRLLLSETSGDSPEQE